MASRHLTVAAAGVFSRLRARRRAWVSTLALGALLLTLPASAQSSDDAATAVARAAGTTSGTDRGGELSAPFTFEVMPSFWGVVFVRSMGTTTVCSYDGQEPFANYGSCFVSDLPQTRVRVRAQPSPGSRFVRWDDPACPRSRICWLTINRDRAIRAIFDPVPFRVYAWNLGFDQFVLSEPRGIRCPPECASTFRAGTRIRLKAFPPSTDDRRVTWGLGCAAVRDSGSTCIAPANAYFVSVGLNGAIPEEVPFALSVRFRVLKTGAGTVTGRGIRCGFDCGETYEWGDSVRLAAQPHPGWRFVRWQGACAQRAQCRVVPGEIVSIRAVFRRR